MAATMGAWNKPGAWALDSEEHEDELLQQQKDETIASAAGAGNNHSTAALSDFPALSVAASTKTKKKKGQTISLAEFSTYGGPKSSQPQGLTPEDMMMLPTGPRQRTAEEMDRTRLGGGFRSYGSNNNSESRWGNNNNNNSRGSDEPRRQGSFGRDSNKEIAPSRADEIDDWAATKKSGVGGGFERRERGERGGFFDNSQSRADESDSWVSNKSYVPSEGRRFERRGVGFESNGGSADSDNWGKKKEVEPRRFGTSTVGGAFDSLRERRGGYDCVNGGADADNWGKKREEVNGSGRPRLNLQPRKVLIDEEQPNGVGTTVKPKGSNPFGDARPREDVLKEKGQDWKDVDEKLESMKIKASALTDGPSFGKRSFGSGNGRGGLSDDRFERNWRKTDAFDVRPQSAEKPENGVAEEAEDGNSEM